MNGKRAKALRWRARLVLGPSAPARAYRPFCQNRIVDVPVHSTGYGRRDALPVATEPRVARGTPCYLHPACDRAVYQGLKRGRSVRSRGGIRR